MKAVIKNELNIAAIKAWDLVQQSNTLIFVCKGFLSFSGSSEFPHQWKEGETVNTRLYFFGIIPGWKHVLHFTSISDSSMVIYTEEKGGIVQNWKHEIKLETVNDSSCLYTDSIDINAGVFTPIIWLYAHILYRYRQYRWKCLIK